MPAITRHAGESVFECLPRLSPTPVLGGLVRGEATAQYTKLCTVLFHPH